MDSSQISKLELTKNSVLIVRLDRSSGATELRDILHVLKQSLPNFDGPVIFVPAGLALEALDDAAMNAAGWFRK